MEENNTGKVWKFKVETCKWMMFIFKCIFLALIIKETVSTSTEKKSPENNNLLSSTLPIEPPVNQCPVENFVDMSTDKCRIQPLDKILANIESLKNFSIAQMFEYIQMQQNPNDKEQEDSKNHCEMLDRAISNLEPEVCKDVLQYFNIKDNANMSLDDFCEKYWLFLKDLKTGKESEEINPIIINSQYQNSPSLKKMDTFHKKKNLFYKRLSQFLFGTKNDLNPSPKDLLDFLKKEVPQYTPFAQFELPSLKKGERGEQKKEVTIISIQ